MNQQEEQKEMFSPETEKENGQITPDKELELISLSSKPERSLARIEEDLEAIEQNIELFNRIKGISIKLTKVSDWVIQDKDSPYLMDRGAENIAIAFGVDISDVSIRQEWDEDKNGRYYSYVAMGKAYCRKLGRWVQDIGVCSQRDKFFGRVGGEWKPMEQVDKANIRRKAVTNLYNRLIKRVIGLMNLTLDDLKNAGLDVSKLQKVEYRKGSQKAEQSLSKIDIKRRNAIWDMCLQLASGDEVAAKETIKEHSKFTTKKEGKEVYADDIKGLTTSRWISMTLKNVKDAFKKLYPDEPLPYDEKELG